MLETRTYTGPDRRARDRSQGLQLRRRREQPVENERRRSAEGTAQIAGALEMHLDQCKTRQSMVRLLEGWLAEARGGAPEGQDADYERSLERSIAVMKEAPDVETGIAMLHRR